MSAVDLLLIALLGKLAGGKKEPKWPGPGPTGPTGPTGPGKIGPIPGTTGPIGPTPVTQTTWKPYFYIQPDAGEKFGTPYALAGEWHGQGSAWTQIYNFTRSRPLSQGDGGGGGGGGTGMVIPPGDDTTGYIASGKNYAFKGDKLLIPWTWPEPKAPQILARCTPIPAGTPLPGVSQRAKLSGDETPETI